MLKSELVKVKASYMQDIYDIYIVGKSHGLDRVRTSNQIPSSEIAYDLTVARKHFRVAFPNCV